jgi:hypothetical protein
MIIIIICCFRGAWLSLIFVVLGSMIIIIICCFREHDYYYYVSAHFCVWCPYYLLSVMKFCSVVSEEFRWQTALRTDGQDKNNMSPHKMLFLGEHEIIIIICCLREHDYHYDLWNFRFNQVASMKQTYYHWFLTWCYTDII